MLIVYRGIKKKRFLEVIVLTAERQGDSGSGIFMEFKNILHEIKLEH